MVLAWGVVVVAVGGLVASGLLHRWWVTGMNAEVAEVYEMGALVGAWRCGNSLGEDEGGFGRVAIGGTLVKWTVLGVWAGGGASTGVIAGTGVVVWRDLAKRRKKES